MSPALKTLILLLISNTFMLAAWYLHLKIKFFDNKALIVVSIFSWGIAFFEYLVHIPANRIGASVFSLSQLQILQISISLFMFIPFSVIVMQKKVGWDYVLASLLLLMAAYLIFRPK